MDAPEAELTGEALLRGKKALESAKQAILKLEKDGKAMVLKVKDNKNDEVYQSLKGILATLDRSSTVIEHAVCWDELPDGKLITKHSLKTFLLEHKAVAVDCSEKLSGCLARLKSRS